MSDPENIVQGLKLFDAGRRSHAVGDLAEAARCFARASALMPDHAGLLVAYGQLAEEVKDWIAAEKIYRRIGALRPQSGFEGKLGLCLFRQANYADAIPFLQAHLARHPTETVLQLPLAQSLLKENRWRESLPIARGLLAANRNPVNMEIVLNCLFNLGLREETEALVEDALKEFPEDPLLLALCGMHRLKCGDYRRGFALQQAIRRRYQPGKPDMHRPAAAGWDGKPFAGVLLIDAEQGLGEEILCAGMFGELVRMGQRAVISCDPRLLPLFRRSFPALTFVSRKTGELSAIAEQAGPHFRFPALDLACLFRCEPFAHAKPWLKADPELVAQLQRKYDEKFPGQQRWAISWHTVRNIVGAPRSIKILELTSLLNLHGIAWFNTQYGDSSSEISELVTAGVTPPWDDLEIDQTHDINALAAQLSAMDGLVSISNTTVHLAGALGVPTYMLLPKSFPVIWYWGYEGNSSPWYPSVHIIRNSQKNGWTDTTQRLADTLRMHIDPRPSE